MGLGRGGSIRISEVLGYFVLLVLAFAAPFGYKIFKSTKFKGTAVPGNELKIDTV